MLVVVRVADPLEASDVDALVSLRAAWVAEQQGEQLLDDGDFAERFRAWLAAEASRRRFWLAEHAPSGGRAVPVGMLGLLEYHRMPKPGGPTSGWGYVGNVFVLAEHRDAGTGRALLDAAVDWSRERGLARLVLAPSERSVPFYRRAGFTDADSLLVLPLA